ncbi:MAG: DUF1223 domain-containing protein [Rhodobacteraceae bacterium]|nr:DUF1223 domain-containing protein [Paracoccaceae bacterium]
MRLVANLFVLLIWAGTSITATHAGERPLVVVELFTSQGCSSCPPADALLARLAERDDVLALALHVDYWDYIGWADAFARPEHTARQKAYSHVAGMRSIYTPQMVIAGSDHVIGSKPMEIADYIEMFRDKPAQVSMIAHEKGGVLSLEAKPATHAPLPTEIFAVLVQFTALENVKITRGENAGRDVAYVNVVTAMEKVGHWDGQGILALETRLDGDGPAAVFLQAAGPGEILAAMRVR